MATRTWLDAEPKKTIEIHNTYYGATSSWQGPPHLNKLQHPSLRWTFCLGAALELYPKSPQLSLPLSHPRLPSPSSSLSTRNWWSSVASVSRHVWQFSSCSRSPQAVHCRMRSAGKKTTALARIKQTYKCSSIINSLSLCYIIYILLYDYIIFMCQHIWAQRSLDKNTGPGHTYRYDLSALPHPHGRAWMSQASRLLVHHERLASGATSI